MNIQTLTIKAGETVHFETLTITNTGGEHQLLMSTDGGDGDEVYFASIELQAPGEEKLEKHVMSPRGDEPVDFVYDRYLIHTKDVDRNGESVTLEVMLNTAPRRITIRRDETVTIGDIGIKNTPMGHKMMEDGTEESFVMLTFSKGDVVATDTLYNGDSTTFEYLAIQVIRIESDGEGVILEVRDTRIPLESLENPDTQTLEIKNGETITVFDLTLTHKGGGHEMADNGNDPSWINLVLSTPRVLKFYHWNKFANESKNPDADIIFDNYVIRVIKVDFDGVSALLSVQKNSIHMVSEYEHYY